MIWSKFEEVSKNNNNMENIKKLIVDSQITMRYLIKELPIFHFIMKTIKFRGLLLKILQKNLYKIDSRFQILLINFLRFHILF
jgi:hypothetical protein